MQKKSKIIIISVVSAILLIVGIFTAIALTGKGSDTEKVATEKLSLGQKFLLGLEYDKAVAEFQAVIDIEPKNADAYIGLADAYIGMGDKEKAIETLEKGLSETGDETIRAKLDELKKPEETTAEVDEEQTMTMEIFLQLSDKYKEYLENQFSEMNKYLEHDEIIFEAGKDIEYDKINDLLYLINYDYISKEETDRLIENKIISENKEDVINNAIELTERIAYWNGTFPYYCRKYTDSHNIDYDSLISFELLMYKQNDLITVKNVHDEYVDAVNYRAEAAQAYLEEKRISRYAINEESKSFEYMLRYYDSSSRAFYIIDLYSDEEKQVIYDIINETENELREYIMKNDK